MNFKIRKAEATDMIHVYGLIKELAAFQNIPNAPKLDVKKLIEDGFECPTPAFKCLVAEVYSSPNDHKIVGYSIYFNTYSSWEGFSMFLDHLYVKPEYRKYHIGLELMKTIAKEAVFTKCGRLDGCVRSWSPAMKFYEKLNAVNLTKTGKLNYLRIQKGDLEKLIKSKI